MNLPQIQRILQDFEKESSQMDMKEEMMGDSIDDAMEEDEGEGNEEEESGRILEEVLAEIGVSVGQQVRRALRSSPLPPPASFSFLLLGLHRAPLRTSGADPALHTARRDPLLPPDLDNRRTIPTSSGRHGRRWGSPCTFRRRRRRRGGRVAG